MSVKKRAKTTNGSILGASLTCGRRSVRISLTNLLVGHDNLYRHLGLQFVIYKRRRDVE